MPALPRQTGRLVLRTPAETDRRAFVGMYEASWEHLRPWSPAMKPGETWDAFFDRQRDRAARELEEGTSVRLLAFTRDTGALVGTFNLNNITRGVAEYADAGWLLDVRHLERGYATEGVLALLDLAFAPEPEGLGLHRVQAGIIPRNAASLRVAERCGFVREGLARKYIRINGAWEDHVIVAKLVDEHVIATRASAARESPTA